jgi:hypothetical protein
VVRRALKERRAKNRSGQVNAWLALRADVTSHCSVQVSSSITLPAPESPVERKDNGTGKAA